MTTQELSARALAIWHVTPLAILRDGGGGWLVAVHAHGFINHKLDAEGHATCHQVCQEGEVRGTTATAKAELDALGAAIRNGEDVDAMVRDIFRKASIDATPKEPRDWRTK